MSNEVKKNIKNILSDEEQNIDEEKLMDYVNGKLSKEELHEIEMQMADSDFMNDAVEGLKEFSSKKDISLYAEQLNKDLHKNIQKKKSRKQKRKLKDQPWIMFTIILLLLLMIVSYLVIKNHLDKKATELPSVEQRN